ncbi:MAG: hypothetical protein NTW80_00385 [Deltaproteobacteria bacterium]|nr:hypothetical protein [Deltaproteobacteria bacterium]
MKTKIIFVTIAVILLVLPAINWAKEKSLTPGEEAGLRLLALQSKGYITISLGDPSTFILVEPKAWQVMMHKDKVNLCRLAVTYVRELNHKDGSKREFVFLQDMTSRKDLGRGFIQTGTIEIFK